jgi:hypothetical protein
MENILIYAVFVEAAAILYLFCKYHIISEKLNIVDEINSMVFRICDTQDDLRKQYLEISIEIKKIKKLISDRNISS